MFLGAFLFGFVCGVSVVATVIVMSAIMMKGRDDDEFGA